MAKVKELVGQEIDFKNDQTIEMSRQKSPWPKDDAEADAIWHGRIASELLQEKLSEHPIEPGPKLIAKRYERLARNVHEQDQEEQVKLFLDALAQTYDPHSEYLSKADLKNFSINMGLSLVGIGAMLRTEDGYAKIESLVPGGPAQTDGRLKVGDRITAVAQGSGEFNDVRDMRLDKVVEQIRGKKGTHVRLMVIPSDAPDPSKRKTIELFNLADSTQCRHRSLAAYFDEPIERCGTSCDACLGRDLGALLASSSRAAGPAPARCGCPAWAVGRPLGRGGLAAAPWRGRNPAGARRPNAGTPAPPASCGVPCCLLLVLRI